MELNKNENNNILTKEEKEKILAIQSLKIGMLGLENYNILLEQATGENLLDIYCKLYKISCIVEEHKHSTNPEQFKDLYILTLTRYQEIRNKIISKIIEMPNENIEIFRQKLKEEQKILLDQNNSPGNYQYEHQKEILDLVDTLTEDELKNIILAALPREFPKQQNVTEMSQTFDENYIIDLDKLDIDAEINLLVNNPETKIGKDKQINNVNTIKYNIWNLKSHQCFFGYDTTWKDINDTAFMIYDGLNNDMLKNR